MIQVRILDHYVEKKNGESYFLRFYSVRCICTEVAARNLGRQFCSTEEQEW